MASPFAAHIGRCFTHWVRGCARSLLGPGEWLRGENRRIDARRHQMFAAMGVGGFAELIARELLAPGKRDRMGGTARLTVRETQITWPAGDGLFNPEIDAPLFVSPAPSRITCPTASPSSPTPPA